MYTYSLSREVALTIAYNTQLINTNVQHKDIETSKNRVNQITQLKQTK